MQCHRLTTNNSEEDAEGRNSFEYRPHRVGLLLETFEWQQIVDPSLTNVELSRSFFNGQRQGQLEEKPTSSLLERRNK